MDPGKRRALTNWLNALSEKKVQKFTGLRDGTLITHVLLTCGDNLIPSDTDLSSPQKCLLAVKCYIESFYHQSLDDGTLINFGLLADDRAPEDVMELEVGKLLLALLGCVIQDRGRENFITPALTMDEASQAEMRMIILSTICRDDTETKLEPGFHKVLTEKQGEPSSQLDAALFFQLVAEGGTTAVRTPGPQTPTAQQGSSLGTMYTNSPQASHPGGVNIRDISSPLRLMSLSSPVTPLGALMSSPQLTQKAALRQKDYEYRRLEAALRSEQHLRSEIELDLEETHKTMQDKEKTIRDLERQLQDVRQVRDRLDELEELQTANDALNKNITRLQTRLQEAQDVREHNAVLLQENTDYLAELDKARTELKRLKSTENACEEFRLRCHKLQISTAELEAELANRREECTTLGLAVEETRVGHQAAQAQCKVLRQEKEELEELLGIRHAEMAGSIMNEMSVGRGGSSGGGESMTVVTEKKLAELQSEYEKMRASWIDPGRHTSIVEELKLEKETKKTYEERYFEVKKELCTREDDLQRLAADLQRAQASLAVQESSLREAAEMRQNLESQVTSLSQAEEALRRSEEELKLEAQQKGAEGEALRTELSRVQAELQCSQKELAVSNETIEERRATILQMDQDRLQQQQLQAQLTKEVEKLTKEADKLSKEVEVWKAKGEQLIESQKQVAKLEIEKENITTRLSEKVESLEEEIVKVNDTLKAEKKMFETKLTDVENRLLGEKSEHEKQVKEKEKLQEELEELKVSAAEKEKSLEDKLETAEKEKRAIDLDMHRLSLQLSSSTDSFSSKLEKMDARYKDETELLNKEISCLKKAKDECLNVQDRLKEEIGKLNQTIQKQKDEIQKLNRLVENLKLANSELVDSLEESKRRVVQYEFEVKSVQEKLVCEERQKAALKKESTDRINSLQQQLDETLRKYSTEKSQMRQQIEQMEVDLEHQKQQYTDCNTSWEATLKNTKSEYEKQLNEMKLENEKEFEKHKEVLEELKTSHEAAVEAMKCTIGDLEQQLKNGENVQKELELSVKEKEEMISSMTERVEYLKSVEKSLNSAIVVMEADSDAMKNLITEREKAKTELLESNTKKDEKIKELEDSHSLLLKNIETLQSEKVRLIEDHETYVSMLNSDYTEKLNSLKDTLTGSEQHALKTREEATIEINRLTAELCEKSATFDQLTTEHAEAIENNNVLVQELRVKIEHVESELKESSEVCVALKQERDNVESQLNELRGAYSDLQKELERSIDSASNAKVGLESKLSCESSLRADLEAQLGVMTEQHKVMNVQLETLTREKATLEETQEACKADFEKQMSELKEKLDETEHYWKSQCEDLAEEYEKGTEEQKENMSQQLEELRSKYEEQLEKLSDEKDMCIASQVQSYQEKVHGLEKAISEKKEDLAKQAEEIAAMEEKYNQTVEGLRSELMQQTDAKENLSTEMEGLRRELGEVKEASKTEVEMLIGQYETQLEELSVQLKEEHEATVKTLEEGYQAQVSKLQGEVEEQRINYQQMISDMEERLGGEATALQERYSQMKCMYDTLIETKEKETKSKVSDLEKKVSEFETKVSELEQTVASSEEAKLGLRSDIEVLNNELVQTLKEKSELVNKNQEFENVINNMKDSHEELDKRCTSLQELIDSIQSELGAVKESAKRAVEEVTKEKGEVEELKRQLEYSRDRNDTLTAELSSQQQQLAAVEEEKRVLECEITRRDSQHGEEISAARLAHDKHALEVEELERQLQATHKCLEAHQKSQSELESQLSTRTDEHAALEQKVRELEQRAYGHLERERKLQADKEHQVQKAAELNGTLQRRLDEKVAEVHVLKEQFDKKIAVMEEEFGRTKKQLQSMTEAKTVLEIDAAQLKPVQDKLRASEAEVKRLTDVNTQYNVHYNKKKATIADLESRLKEQEREAAELRQTEAKLLEETAPLREKLDIERMKNSKLNAKVRTLEASADLADRKLREYQQALEKSSTVFLGDSSEFQRMIRERESSNDASFMEKHPSSMPLNDSVFELEKHDVDKHQAFFNQDDTIGMAAEKTLTPNTRASRSRKRMSKSVSSSTVISASDKDADVQSIGSATSLAYRLRSRESAVSLNRSYTSVNSCKSNSSVPRGTGGIFHCEDEPMEFEWGRLGELQRRNTLCPAHLKTSYPVETQTYKPTRFREDALRESTMGNSTVLENLSGSGRKRKQGWSSPSDESDSDGRNKLAKTGTAYHKPGPPTPANQRRNSGKGSRSPGSRNSKGSKSPRTPSYSLRSKRTPRHTPKRAGVADNRENAGSSKKAGWRDSVSFQIGFSPQSSTGVGSNKHLRRQQAFVQKQPPSSTQTQIRKPLGTRNILQTGV